MPRSKLYLLGLGWLLAGAVLTCVGGYRLARSPEFLAAYRVRYVESVYAGSHMETADSAYFDQEIRRLRSGSLITGIGLGLLLGGVIVARYAGPVPSRRKTRRVGVFSKQRIEIARRRTSTVRGEMDEGGSGSDRPAQ